MRSKCWRLFLYVFVVACVSGCVFNSDDVSGLAVGTVPEEIRLPEIQPEQEIVDSKTEEELLEEDVERYLASMTLEEKAAQMFIILPESMIDGVDCVTAAGETTQNAIGETPVGGFVYLSRNLHSYDQVRAMLNNVQVFSVERIGFPMFLCVDEEGGSVARIGENRSFGVEQFEDMAEVGRRQDPEEAFEIGASIGNYLHELGFNVDFAPVADVLTNPENQVVRKRAFGSDAALVEVMADAVARGLDSQGVLGTYKHFPGHGDTTGDTHKGYAYSNKSREELYECELIPFIQGIENKIPFIMVGHISFPNITGDDTPASLSSVIIEGLLREELGYEGIVITDAMNMGAVTQQYSSAEAAVKAIQAGVDIVLMPADFKEAYAGVLHAVEEGILTEERLNESVARIIRAKIRLL